MQKNEEKECFVCNLILKPELKKGARHEEMAEWVVMNMLVPKTAVTTVYRAQVPKEFWGEWYQHHADKPFFNELTDYMSGGEVTIIPIKAYDKKTFSLLLENIKELVGPSASQPGPFRKKFAVNTTYNAIHRPDCCESAKKEETRLKPFKNPKTWMKNFKFKEVWKMATAEAT